MASSPDSRGLTILILGILGLVVCAPLGIVAWVLGNQLLLEPDLDVTQRHHTTTGILLGQLAVGLMALVLIGCGLGLAVWFTCMI